MHPVRNSVKALIIKNNKLLCIGKEDKEGVYYVLPGGGQEKNETFIEALKRECIEEIGARVEVREIKYIREYIGKNHEFKLDHDCHQVEYMFMCELLEDPDLAKATHHDEGQFGLVWVDINDYESRVYPRVLLKRLNENYADVYWGDVN